VLALGRVLCFIHARSLQEDVTVEQVEELGILREVDPRVIAQKLIDEGKAGWEPADWRNPMENLGNLFDRYTLGQGSLPFTIDVAVVSGNFVASLKTCLSQDEYVGSYHTEPHAKQEAAKSFLRDPNVKKLFGLIPPKQGDIRHKVVLYTEEKRACEDFGVTRVVQNLIVRKRIDDVLAVFHDMGYRTDVWDFNV